MVNCLVQVSPPLVDCQSGAFGCGLPHAPENAVMTISRRVFVAGSTFLLLAPLPWAGAQQGKKGPRIALVFANASEAAITGPNPRAQGARVFLERMRELGWVDGEKVGLLAAVSDDVIKKGIKAGDLIKQIAPIVGGGGGGRPNMAQAGGKEPGKRGEALASARRLVEQQLTK